MDSNGITSEGDVQVTEVTYISPDQIACFLPNNQVSYRTRLGSNDPLIHTAMDTERSVVQLTYDGACYECDIEAQSCERKQVLISWLLLHMCRLLRTLSVGTSYEFTETCSGMNKTTMRLSKSLYGHP